VKNKKPEEALGYYEVGLELYPTWPKDISTLPSSPANLASMKTRSKHMQAYLELAPNAPDAQSRAGPNCDLATQGPNSRKPHRGDNMNCTAARWLPFAVIAFY